MNRERIEYLYEQYQERVAIMMFDGGVTEQQAMYLAFVELMEGLDGELL